MAEPGKSETWTIEEIMQCIENMGISINLQIQAVHRYNPGGKLDWHQQEFINKHYFKITDYLTKKLVEKHGRST